VVQAGEGLMEPLPCDVIKDGHHIGFYPKLDIIRKRRQMKIFDARHAKYDTSKQLLQTVSKGYAYSYGKRQVPMKNRFE